MVDVGVAERRREALVVCGEKMSAGITMYDLETGEELMRLPTCASPPHGLLCLADHHLVASQLQRHRSYRGGAIFFWALNKPQSPHRSYPPENIGPISSSKDGIYLAGGAPAGNVYIWEVTSGKLLKIWPAHQNPLSCLAFSHDGTLLISASEDGVIHVWSMISLLDVEDPQICGTLSSVHTWCEHQSSVTGLLLMSGGCSLSLISSSLDGTCKVWDVISGRLVQTYVFSAPVTAIASDPQEQLLFAGCMDGRILVSELNLGLEETPSTISEDSSGFLGGHKDCITTLSFSPGGKWLISASKDGAACIWDANLCQLLRRFSYKKDQNSSELDAEFDEAFHRVSAGYITNLLVISQSMLSVAKNKRSQLRPHVSLLDKSPQPNAATERTRTILPAYCSQEDHFISPGFQTYRLMKKQILELEREGTPEALEMKVVAAVENRLWTSTVTKHMITINKHLQTRLLDMIQRRLCDNSELAHASTKKSKTKVLAAASDSK
ncbi:protein ROOT INITIATION DEFECTIVE 3-like [Musa acuminata AAA Group]|uniref:protein ROOT INITIATION DEFECTIVE 3-like n=1 Tax=Musa acuminata AAA Group TaxID=214697 RepID=UPI0031D9466D